MRKKQLINVWLDVELLKVFDTFLAKRGYNDRAEAIRQAIREFIQKGESGE